MENRYQCPFYGFYLSQIRTLVNQNGNQCALITDSFSPCGMEMRHEQVNWQECPLNNPRTQHVVYEMRVFDGRVQLSNTRPGGPFPDNIPFDRWYELTVNGKPIN